jgi:hypothetical protein
MTDGCVHLLYNSSWKFHQFAVGKLLSGKPVLYGPPITYKTTPAGSLSSSQPVGPQCWAIPLAFGLIVILSLVLLGGSEGGDVTVVEGH